MIRSLDNMQTSFDFLMLMMVLTFISGIFKKLRTKKEFTGLDLFQIVLYSVMWVPLFFELYFEEITKEKFDDCSESESLERQLEEANTEIRDLNDMLVALREETDAELAEARELLLKVQDSMSNLSTHSHEGWAIACADDTFNMIEQYVDVIELKEKGE